MDGSTSRQSVNLLNNTFAVSFCTDEDASTVVFKSARKYFAGAGALVIDKDYDRLMSYGLTGSEVCMTTMTADCADDRTVHWKASRLDYRAGRLRCRQCSPSSEERFGTLSMHHSK